MSEPLTTVNVMRTYFFPGSVPTAELDGSNSVGFPTATETPFCHLCVEPRLSVAFWFRVGTGGAGAELVGAGPCVAVVVAGADDEAGRFGPLSGATGPAAGLLEQPARANITAAATGTGILMGVALPPGWGVLSLCLSWR